MTWSKFDDGYDEHEKIENAWFDDEATIGLHAMATTACNRWLSDGVIRPRWLQQKLPAARRMTKVLAATVKHGLFDVLKAGATVDLEDSAGNTIRVGPFGEDRYLVHDFLDRHESSVQVKERRRKDAERKGSKPPSGKPGGFRLESVRNPDGVPEDSKPSRTRGRAGAGAPPDPTRPDQVPPVAPRKRGEALDLREPSGNRQRDRRAWRDKITRLAAEMFPGGPVRSAEACVESAGRVSRLTTTAAIYEHAERWFPDLSIPAEEVA